MRTSSSSSALKPGSDQTAFVHRRRRVLAHGALDQLGQDAEVIDRFPPAG
ncbi:MAG: hypothetical protein MZV70_29060 [Desulfobacterales bacterium]|nr:hypothetical protein [Desulfobacterales bacterium]